MGGIQNGSRPPVYGPGGALPVHHTATTREPWDGPAAVAAMPGDDTTLAYCHAWEDGGGDGKASYRFPHHAEDGGPANLAACRNGLARLSPASGDTGIKAHLQTHLNDGRNDQ